MAVRPIPEGQHSITPYLGIRDAAKAIAFYKDAFGAREMFRLEGPDGRIGHAELKIGDASLMLGEPCDQAGSLKASQSIEQPAIGLHLYVEDCDTVYAKAIAAGARPISEVKDQFYGDRSGTLKDPFGNLWFIASRQEDLSPDQIRARAAQLFSPN